MRLFCIADNDSALGFRLSGIETMEVRTARDAEAALKVAFSAEGVGILVITRKAADLVREKVNGMIYTQEVPLVLEVPSLGDKPGAESADDLLKGAIGMSV